MKSLVKYILSKAGYTVTCARHIPLPLRESKNLRTFEFDDAVFRRMHEVGTTLTFLQIGVYDGITNDPLRHHIVENRWKGVMVEPQRGSVDSLKLLYRNHPEIRIINAAVDATARERILYTVFGPGAPDWVGGLASFDRETVAKHEKWYPGLSSMIHEESVSCLPFDTILAELPGDRIDILQIDTEGADGWILSLFPFDRIRPAIVHYEIKHLDKAEQEQALNLLLKHGYRLARSGAEDMLAVIG